MPPTLSLRACDTLRNVTTHRTVADLKGHVDAVILTIRGDEDRALSTLLGKLTPTTGGRSYRVATLAGTGRTYTVALLRLTESGNGPAQDAARDAIEQLDPRMLMLVGIAGAVPAPEFTLGDVMVATRISDLRVQALLPDAQTQLDLRSVRIHKKLGDRLANLIEPPTWTQLVTLARPPVPLDASHFRGSSAWNDKIRNSLESHFHTDNPRNRPIYFTGVIGSSDFLVRDPTALNHWLDATRKTESVEMEAAGVMEAADRIDATYPVVIARGLSDIVGYARDPRWTAYACQSAAAFAVELLRSGQLDDIAPYRSETRPSTTSPETSTDTTTKAGASPRTSAAADVRARVWNVLHVEIFEDDHNGGTSDPPGELTLLFLREIWGEVLAKPIDELSRDATSAWKAFRDLVMNCPDHVFYSVVQHAGRVGTIRSKLNIALERAHAPYRFLGESLQPVSNGPAPAPIHEGSSPQGHRPPSPSPHSSPLSKSPNLLLEVQGRYVRDWCAIVLVCQIGNTNRRKITIRTAVLDLGPLGTFHPTTPDPTGLYIDGATWQGPAPTSAIPPDEFRRLAWFFPVNDANTRRQLTEAAHHGDFVLNCFPVGDNRVTLVVHPPPPLPPRIDLNNPSEFTLEKVAAMLAAGNDAKMNQVRVTLDGVAYLSEGIVGNQQIDGLAFRLETFVAGNGYVGPGVADSRDFIDRIFRVLKKNWPTPSSTYIDVF